MNSAFDASGNMVSEKVLGSGRLQSESRYSYDAENRMVRVETSVPGVDGVDMPAIGPRVTEMVYDHNGMRARKSEGGADTLYHYDLSNNVICETDGAGSVLAVYVYANGMRIARIDASGKTLFFHNDPLGSPALITDDSGREVQRYAYDPFGTISLSKGETDNRYTFTGKEYDADSGLMYYGARFYDPKIGRFITHDIAEPDPNNPQSLNRYVYCLNNPLKYVDPDGRDAMLIVDQWVLGGLGHMALYFQNGNGSWFRMDFAPKTYLSLPNFLVGVKGPGKYSVKAIENISYDIEKYQADSIYFHTSIEQDIKISHYILSMKHNFDQGKADYVLFSNNCVDQSLLPLEAASVFERPGILSPIPKLALWQIWNKMNSQKIDFSNEESPFYNYGGWLGINGSFLLDAIYY